MIAVIYSGSRYANWKLAFKGEVVADFKTAGINPFFNDEKYITHLLNKNIKLIHFAEKIKNRLPTYIQLHSLKLQETETSFAEWFMSDNDKQ